MGIVHTAKKILALAASLALVSLLAGCLSTKEPLYDSGVKVKVAGTLACANTDGSPGIITVAQRPQNSAKPDEYSYRAFFNSDGSIMDLLFQATSAPGIYITQAKKEDSSLYYYVWYDEASRKFFQVDRVSDELNAIAAKHNVEVQSGTWEIPMTGRLSNTRSFLNDLDVSRLEAMVTCIPL